MPLPLIAGYLDRYGLRADTIRVTSRDIDHQAGRERTTWIGLTFSATDNLAALQARSPQIPLDQTAAVVARRLADHLRESGWVTGVVEPDDIEFAMLDMVSDVQKDTSRLGCQIKMSADLDGIEVTVAPSSSY